MSYFISVEDSSAGVRVYAVGIWSGAGSSSGDADGNVRNVGDLGYIVGHPIPNESDLNHEPYADGGRFYVRPNRTPLSTTSTDTQFFISNSLYGEQRYLTYSPSNNRFSPSETAYPAASKYNVQRIAAPATAGYRSTRRFVVSEDGTNTADNKYITIKDWNVQVNAWEFKSTTITATSLPAYARLVFRCDKGSGPVRGGGYFHHIRSVATGSELYALTNGSAAAAMTPLSFVATSLLNNTTTSFSFIPRQVPGVDGATKYTYSIKTGAVDAAGTPLYLCMNEAEDPNDPNLRVFSIQLRPEYGVREWEEWEVVPTTIGANFGRFRLVSTAFPPQCLCCPPSAGIALAANLDSSTAVAQGYADFEIYEFKASSARQCAVVSISKGEVAETTTAAGAASLISRRRLAAVIVSLILIVAVIIVFAFPGTAAAAMRLL